MAGRKPFEPTKEERALVAALVAYLGMAPARIVLRIKRPRGKTGELKPISRMTLQKYFAEELATAAEDANSRVAEAMFKRAIDLKHPQGAISGMFWLKAQAGWKDRGVVEHVGKDGGPIMFDLSDASPEELEVLERYLARKAAKLSPANDEEAA
jgi:hypothetical protein